MSGQRRRPPAWCLTDRGRAAPAPRPAARPNHRAGGRAAPRRRRPVHAGDERGLASV